MSVPLTTQPHIAALAENGRLDESAVSDEIQHDACLETSPYFSRKALATRVLGAMMLVITSPLILLLVVLVWCTSAGPGLFRQQRIGKGRREFTMYKIRTMHEDAEKATGPIWCRPADSRITCIGRMLRFLHLDELPQLINIVRGEMDLVGPRPERPGIVSWLEKEIPLYSERLAILPGVTGLAQINLPPDETRDCVRRKLVLDLEYIATASLGLDFRILLCTAMRMMGIRHGRAVRLLRLEYMLSDNPPRYDFELQSDIARRAMQTYLFSCDQSKDDIPFSVEVTKADGRLAHAECLRIQSDALAEIDEVESPLSTSLPEVARANPR